MCLIYGCNEKEEEREREKTAAEVSRALINGQLNYHSGSMIQSVYLPVHCIVTKSFSATLSDTIFCMTLE